MGKKVIRSLVLAMIIAGTIVLGVGCAIALPALDPAKLEMPDQVTRIYSLDNPTEPVIEIRPDKGEPVQFDKLKPYVKQAIIATEDRNFYNHDGISYRAIARAIYRDLLSGSKAEGASTITQQVARNAFLNQEKTFTRKFQEIALAVQIEREYTKDDILEMYMNKVNFHPSAIGLEAAAKIYFNKSAVDLTLGEAAFLAGLPQAPSYYYDNLDAALKRRDTVLQNMVKEGYITEQQAEEAKNIKINEKYKQTDNSKFRYPHYVEYVLDEAERKYGIPKEQVMRGGLNIYTYLDPKAQNIVETNFKNSKFFPQNAADGTKVQGAMVIVDPKSGGIKALVGGRETDSFMDWNRAFQSKRQPGSAIKPLVVYGPAVETGKYGPQSMLKDEKGMTFGNPPYAPRDWDDHKVVKRERPGEVTMRTALQWSLNIPAVYLLDQIGIDTGKSFAEKAGIHFSQNDAGLGIALGGLEEGVSVLSMADAYQAFANKGMRKEAHAIQKITTSSKAVLAQDGNIPSVRVMKESTANTITSLLQVVVNEGTATGAKIGRPVAGKTGTTEFGNGGNKDTWFVGYTPELVAAVWMGFDRTDNNHFMRDTAQGYVSAYPAKLFGSVMSQVLQGKPVSQFPVGAAEKPEKKEQKVINLTGEWNGKTVKLKWNPLEGNVQYFVFRTENVEQAEGGPPIGLPKEPEFVDTEVQPGKSYYYVVTAIDPENKDSEIQSNVVLVKTTAGTGDGQPQNPLVPPGTPGEGGTSTGGTPGGTPGGSTPGNSHGTSGPGGGSTGGSNGETGTSGKNGASTGGSSNGTSGGQSPSSGTNGTSTR